MSYLTKSSFTLSLCLLFIATSTIADGFNKKEVYSFKDAQGNTVFTDRKPTQKNTYKTQIVESANSTALVRNNQSSYENKIIESQITKTQTVRIIVEQDSATRKKSYKNSKSIKRCKSYKKKFDYYSDKMKSGYKNSEYKKLDSKRKKYRTLLFKNCDTNTFSD